MMVNADMSIENEIIWTERCRIARIVLGKIFRYHYILPLIGQVSWSARHLIMIIVLRKHVFIRFLRIRLSSMSHEWFCRLFTIEKSIFSDWGVTLDTPWDVIPIFEITYRFLLNLEEREKKKRKIHRFDPSQHAWKIGIPYSPSQNYKSMGCQWVSSSHCRFPNCSQLDRYSCPCLQTLRFVSRLNVRFLASGRRNKVKIVRVDINSLANEDCVMHCFKSKFVPLVKTVSC